MVMQAPQEIVKKLSQFIREAAADNLDLQAAILFGSYVKGTRHETSDIDVALVSPRYENCNYLEELVKAVELFEKFDIRIELHLFSPEEMRDTKNPIVREILQTGVTLFNRSN